MTINLPKKYINSFKWLTTTIVGKLKTLNKEKKLIPLLSLIISLLVVTSIILIRINNSDKTLVNINSKSDGIITASNIIDDYNILGSNSPSLEDYNNNPEVLGSVSIPGPTCSYYNNSSRRILKIGDSISNDSRYLPDAVNIAADGASTRWFLTRGELDNIPNPSLPSWPNDSQMAERLQSELDRGGFAAVIMLGTNDCGGLTQDEYQAAINTIIQKVKDADIIPILSTIPPRRPDCIQGGVSSWNNLIRDIATQQNIPLRQIAVGTDEQSDFIHLNDYGNANLNSQTCGVINEISGRCNVDADYNCDTNETINEESPLTITSSNTTVGGVVTNSPDVEGTGICSKLGINSASLFGRPRDPGGRNGTGWYLAIAEHPSEVNSSICGEADNIIVRPWCDGTSCPNFFANVNELANNLKNLDCDVYVTGPNEPVSEMNGDVGATIQAMRNLVNAVGGAPNVKILTPAFNATHPNRGSFIPAVSAGLPWGQIHGIALNSYTIPGNTASGFMNDTLGLIGRNLPVYVTETGPIEENSGVDRDTAINNLKNEVNAMAQRAEAVLFFNGSGDNPGVEFQYGCIESDEIDFITDGQCPDDGQSYCGERLKGLGSLDSASGCCEFVEDKSLKSCDLKQLFDNGKDASDYDTVNAGLEMIKITQETIQDGDIPPGYEGNYDFPEGEERWIYKYAITEQIHNVPLLQFLAGVEGTASHPFTTDAQQESNLNFYSDSIFYTDQFPGISSFNLASGGEFQLQVPSLGTASATGDYRRDDFFELTKPHCGVRWRSENPDQINSGAENNEFLSYFKKFLISNQDPEVVKWDESTKSKYVNFLEQFLDFLLGRGGDSDDTCVDACSVESAGAPLRACDPSDGLILDIKTFETLVDDNIIRGWELPSMEPLEPDQVCDLMFGGRIDGGTCHMSNGFTLPEGGAEGQAEINYAISKGIAQPGDTSADSGQIYNSLKQEGQEGVSISGQPFYRYEMGWTGQLKLEGLLKFIEELYITESHAFVAGSNKICHNDNVGIRVPSTRRLYDYYLSSEGAEDTNIPQDYGLDDSAIVPNINEQIFFAVDAGGDAKPYSSYGMCNPKTFPMIPGEKVQFNPKFADATSGTSVATVEHYFPWVGQIPLMLERISIWSLHPEYGFTDQQAVKSLNNLDPDGEAYDQALGLLRQNFEKMNAVSPKFIDAYLFPCGFFDTNSNGTYTTRQGGDVADILEDVFGFNDEDIQRINEGDCICNFLDSDPMQNYLFEEGMLEQELERLRSYQTDTDSDGIPDQCTVSTGPVDGEINPVGGTPIDIEEFQSPVANIDVTQDYGTTSLSYGCQGNWHNALDLGTEQEIQASAAGRVIWAGEVNNISGEQGPGYDAELSNYWQYGKHVLIEHPNGYRTRYAHMARLDVEIGDNVEQGEVIGLMGSSGNSDGIHLHFEIQKPYCTNWCNTDCFEDPTFVLDNAAAPPGPDEEAISSVREDIICREYISGDDQTQVDDEYTYPQGSQEDHICLAKDVANFLNGYNGKSRIPWYVILAAWESETKRRCHPLYATFFTTLDQNRLYPPIGTAQLRSGATFPVYNHQDQCGGDPNQLAFTDVQTLDKDGKGIGGHLKGTFLALIKDWYWYKPDANADDTGELLSACMDYLGVDRNIGQEDSSEPFGAFWDWTNSSGYFVPNDEKTELKQQFSRKRVGDALCAMAIQLSENAANNRTGYVDPNNWTYDDIVNASYGYYGACEFGGGNYCENMIARSELFNELYKDVDCSGGAPSNQPGIN